MAGTTHGTQQNPMGFLGTLGVDQPLNELTETWVESSPDDRGGIPFFIPGPVFSYVESDRYSNSPIHR